MNFINKLLLIKALYSLRLDNLVAGELFEIATRRFIGNLLRAMAISVSTTFR